MKTIVNKLILGLALIIISSLSYGQIQVIDVSTGRDNNTGLAQAVNAFDDTWMVAPPSSGYTQVRCGTGSYNSSPSYAYPCQPTNSRYISPALDANGNAISTGAGTYYYRMSFNTTACAQTITGATFNFSLASADNQGVSIKINSYAAHAVSFGFNPCSTNFSMTIPPGEFNIGLNTIVVEVGNLDTYTALALTGSLTLNYTSGAATPSFTNSSPYCISSPISFNGSGSTGTNITHYKWKLEKCDAVGNLLGYTWQGPTLAGTPGVYTLPSNNGTLGGPNLACNNYYKVTLGVKNCNSVWSYTSQIIYVRCGPTVSFGSSTSSLPCTGYGSASITPTTTGNWANYSVTLLPGPGYFGYTQPMGSTFTMTPTSTTTYTFVVTDNTTGCSTTATWTVQVGIALNLQGSTSRICLGSMGGISVMLPNGYPMANYTMTIQEMPSGNTIYTGSPNTAILVSPTVTTTYKITVTDRRGCSTVVYYTITVIKCKPTFNPNPNTTRADYYTLSALADDGPEGGEPGFGYAWFLEELDPGTEDALFTIVDPECWHTADATLPNVFEAFDATNPDGYSGEYYWLECPGDEGKFLYDHTYRITRSTWSDDTEWDQYSVILTQSYGKNGSELIVKETTAPDMRNLLTSAKSKAKIAATLSDKPFTVWPNPSTGMFKVSASTTNAGAIEVYDLMGKRIQQVEMSAGVSEYNIDLSGFSKGIYLINITSGNKTVTQKIVIE